MAITDVGDGINDDTPDAAVKKSSEKARMQKVRQAVLAQSSDSVDSDDSDDEEMKRIRDMSVEVKPTLQTSHKQNKKKAEAKQKEAEAEQKKAELVAEAKKEKKIENKRKAAEDERKGQEKKEKKKRKAEEEASNSSLKKAKKDAKKDARQEAKQEPKKAWPRSFVPVLRRACAAELEAAEGKKLKYADLRKQVAKRIAADGEDIEVSSFGAHPCLLQPLFCIELTWPVALQAVKAKVPELGDLAEVLGAKFVVKGKKVKLADV